MTRKSPHTQPCTHPVAPATLESHLQWPRHAGSLHNFAFSDSSAWLRPILPGSYSFFTIHFGSHVLKAFWTFPSGQGWGVGWALPVITHSSICITPTTLCCYLWFLYLSHWMMSSWKTEFLWLVTARSAPSRGPDQKEAPSKGSSDQGN